MFFCVYSCSDNLTLLFSHFQFTDESVALSIAALQQMSSSFCPPTKPTANTASMQIANLRNSTTHSSIAARNAPVVHNIYAPVSSLNKRKPKGKRPQAGRMEYSNGSLANDHSIYYEDH